MALDFDLLSNPGDMIGLALDIESNNSGDQTGFGWALNTDYSTYTGFSFYWDNVNAEATQDDTWLCDSTLSEDDITRQTGYCYNFMPTWDETDFANFYKSQQLSIWGWKNISGSPSVFEIDSQSALLSAVNFAAQFGFVSSTVFALAY
jgi:hypothetical protein